MDARFVVPRLVLSWLIKLLKGNISIRISSEPLVNKYFNILPEMQEFTSSFLIY